MVVLRDSYFSRCGCLAIVEETEPGVVDGICIPDPRRNCIDQEAILGRTHKARTLLVVEAMERSERADPHKRDYVRAGGCAGWADLALERTVGSCWIECFYRSSTASKP